MFRINRPTSCMLLGMLIVSLTSSAVWGDANVYRKVAPHAVIIADRAPLGSGVVIDAQNCYILTAEHVAAAFKGKSIRVYFPDRDKQGRVITSWDHYNRNGVSEVARVVRLDKAHDIAILQVPRLPKGIAAIALAGDSPAPGETVHVIGHSDSFDGGVFSYAAGKVRNVYRQRRMDIRKIIHSAPTNPGDSGGPLVNDKGELVGMISRGTVGMPTKEVMHLAAKVFGMWKKNGALPRFSPASSLSQVRDESVDIHDIREILADLHEFGGNVRPAPMRGSRIPNEFEKE